MIRRSGNLVLKVALDTRLLRLVHNKKNLSGPILEDSHVSLLTRASPSCQRDVKDNQVLARHAQAFETRRRGAKLQLTGCASHRLDGPSSDLVCSPINGLAILQTTTGPCHPSLPAVGLQASVWSNTVTSRSGTISRCDPQKSA